MSDTTGGGDDLLSSVLAATAAEGSGVILPDRETPAPRRAATPEERALAEAERLIAALLGAIQEHPRFQAMTARWRALHRLAQALPAGAQGGIALGCGTKAELARHLRQAPSLDETMVWRGMMEEGLDPAAPRPFAALLLDSAWGAEPEDLDTLQLLGGIAGAVHAPVLADAAPALLGLARWDRLPPPGEMNRRLEGPTHARWRSFRDSEESRFVALVAPPVQTVSATPVGGAWVLAEAVAAGFAETGWGVPPPGWQGEGDGSALTHEDAETLAGIGLVAAVTRGANRLGVPRRPTAHRPKRFDREAATRDARMRAQLDQMLGTGRVAQALQVIAGGIRRSGAGAEATRRALASWLAAHSQGEGAPLAEARVELQPARGGAGPVLVAWIVPRLGEDRGAPEPVVIETM